MLNVSMRPSNMQKSHYFFLKEKLYILNNKVQNLEVGGLET